MASLIQKNFRARKSFAKLKQVIEIPNLIDIQKRSYDKFLQIDIPLDKREDIGLQGVFKSVFPIKDFSETSSLEFVSYNLEKPKYDVDECRARGMTFAAPIKVVIRLVVWDVNEETGVQSIRDVKEQEVYFGEIPLMTDSGTFIINGTERVIVSQLHRSPGVFFDHDKGKTHSSGKLLYSARVIPYRGSWLDFEFDHKDILYVRIDRRRKLHATVLLRALGYSTEELLNYFYDTETIHFEPSKKYSRQVNYELLVGQRATRDIKHPKTKEVLVKKNRKFTKGAIRKLQESRRRPAADRPRRARRQGLARRTSSTRRPAKCSSQCNEELDRGQARRAARARRRERRGPLHRQPQRRPVPPQHAARRQAPGPRRGGHGDLPPPAPGRSADARYGADAVPQPVLQRRALRPVARRPPEAELQVQDRRSRSRRRSSPSATSSRRSAT